MIYFFRRLRRWKLRRQRNRFRMLLSQWKVRAAMWILDGQFNRAGIPWRSSFPRLPNAHGGQAVSPILSFTGHVACYHRSFEFIYYLRTNFTELHTHYQWFFAQAIILPFDFRLSTAPLFIWVFFSYSKFIKVSNIFLFADANFVATNTDEWQFFGSVIVSV